MLLVDSIICGSTAEHTSLTGGTQTEIQKKP